MLRIRIRAAFCLHLLTLSVFSSSADCFAMLSALLVHELCHYVTARIIGEQIEQLELTPFGGIMHYKQGTASHKGIKGILLHAAGPLGNYAFLLLAGIPAFQDALGYKYTRSLILSNLSMLTLNLLPALPLDGGQIVFCLGYYLFSVSKLTTVLSFLGAATGVSGLILAIYGLAFRRILNLSLLIVSLYLIAVAAKSRESLLAENIYAVVQEHLTASASIRRIEQYSVPTSMPLLDLLPFLKQGIVLRVFITDDHGEKTLSEVAICKALLAMPRATLGEAHQLFSQYQEKMTQES